MALRDELNVPLRSELYGFVLADGQAISVLGVSAIGDIPAELWYYDNASTATDDGVSVIQPTAIPPGNPGRYLLSIYNSDWNALDNKPSFATVATSGSYNDLSNTPSNGVPTGTIVAFAGTSAPSGWLFCDGSAVSRTTQSTLFSIVSTTYGMGDGSTTFNLPDTRQRFPLGKAASGTGSTLGSTGGVIDHIHTVDPPSTTTGAPSATVAATILVGGAASTTHTHDVNIAQFDSGANNPPFISLNFIIKT